MQKRNILRWLLLFLLLCNTFVTLNINIAIVSMVNTQNVEITFNKSQTICPNASFFSRNHLENDDIEKSLANSIQKDGYDWSEAEQNLVLSGYHWLNYVSIMLGGILAHKYGSKKVVGFAQVISSAMSSLIPTIAGYGPLEVAWLRAIQGVLSLDCFQSWEIGVHPMNEPDLEPVLHVDIPWKGIISSVPLMATIFAVNSITWTWVAMTTYSPTYLKIFYGLHSNEIGIITSTPYFVVMVLIVGIAYWSDLVLRKNRLSITAVRKICTFLGSIVSAIPLIIIAFTKCDLILTVCCMMINCIMRAFTMFGPLLVVMDLSPKFCGILEGITGTSSSILTFAFATMVNHFTKVYEHDNEWLWKMIFLSTALYGIFANGVFMIFGSAEVQPWNFQDDFELCSKDMNNEANDSVKTSFEMKNGEDKEIR
ncbi:sodium-dependent phosphate transport protein 1-like isoform X2 [Planococcus citri]|uniref:sodium-dependent phosphate transport protein 1-like isoform X2 n=1 Tax=Planococcus citri TaxID=170843 RepID=UPI0031F98C9C